VVPGEGYVLNLGNTLGKSVRLPEGRMFIEHIIFGIGIAVLAGMITRETKERDRSWIIVVGAMAPDIDITVDFLHRVVPELFASGLLVLPLPFHGSFHTIGCLVLFAVGTGLILSRTGVKFILAVSFAGIGFGSHLLEDVLVYSPPGYPYLWPFSSEKLMLPIFSGDWDWFGVANSNVLIVAVCLLVAVLLTRVHREGLSRA